MCVHSAAHVLMWSSPQTNPATVTTATPPDTNKRKIMENNLHKTAQHTIIQTPQPEGAWLWRFIIAYWIIRINLTHLGLCVFPSSQLSRLFVSDNCAKWVISIWAPSPPPLFVALDFKLLRQSLARNAKLQPQWFTQHSVNKRLEIQAVDSDSGGVEHGNKRYQAGGSGKRKTPLILSLSHIWISHRNLCADLSCVVSDVLLGQTY